MVSPIFVCGYIEAIHFPTFSNFCFVHCFNELRNVMHDDIDMPNLLCSKPRS